MQILEHTSLKELTTLQVGGNARFFVSIQNEEELKDAHLFSVEKSLPFFILGGGSNILVPDEGFPGLVIKNEIKGFQRIDESSGSVLITVGAGENWDEVVGRTTTANLSGIENLSLIPGTAGAAPVQNIGAYGVEVKDVIESVRAYDSETQNMREFLTGDCLFSYRDSIFKQQKRYVITSVTLRLRKDAKPNLEYKDVRERVELLGLSEDDLTPEMVRVLVSDIRKQKLPDWKVLPTAGSFFKNPELPTEAFLQLKANYPDLPGYAISSEKVKIPLAWIIEHVCHLKGARVGGARIYEKHALVIVTDITATARDIQELSLMVLRSVYEKTGITIENEVQLVRAS